MTKLSNRQYLAAIVAMLALALACALPAGFAFGAEPDGAPDQGGLAQAGDEGDGAGDADDPDAVGDLDGDLDDDADDGVIDGAIGNDLDDDADDDGVIDGAIGNDLDDDADLDDDGLDGDLDDDANLDDDPAADPDPDTTGPALTPAEGEVALGASSIAVVQPEATAAATTATEPVAAQATKQYTVKFYDAFGNLVKTQKVLAGKNAKAPVLADMVYRTFKGWSVSYKNVKKNLYVYPIYKDKKNFYYLTFDCSSVKGVYRYVMQSYCLKSGTKYDLSRRFASKDQLLIGYTTKPNGKGTFYASPSVLEMPARDLVLYPKFAKTDDIVSLTLKTGRDQYSSTSFYVKGENVTVGTSYLQTYYGYTLVGYRTKPNGEGTFYALGSTYKMPKRNATLYGVWKKNTARLHIVANRTRGVSVDYYLPAGYALPIRPSAEQLSGDFNGFSGIYLKGLTTKKSGKGTRYDMYYRTVTDTSTAPAPSYIKVPKAGLTLYAQWGRYRTVKLVGNYSGGSTTKRSYQYGSNAELNYRGTRDGYQLVGFTTEESGSGTFYYAGSMFRIGKRMTLYAQWRKCNATIKYNENYSDGGTSTERAVGTRQTEVTQFPSREGYEVTSWNTKSDGSGRNYKIGAFLTPTKGTTITLYAQWTKLANVTFDSNYEDGNAGTSAVLPGTLVTGGYLSRSGYTIAGWNTKADGSGTSYGVFEHVKVPKKGLTLYAMWKENAVAVKFDPNGGNNSSGGTDPVSVAAAKGYGIAENGSVPYTYRTGYRLIGWNTKADGTGTSYASSDLYADNNAALFKAMNMTLYAQWQKSPPAVTYDANNGTGRTWTETPRSSQRLDNWVGYTNGNKVLGGWNTKADGTGTAFVMSAYIGSMPAEGLTLYCRWKNPTAWITFSGNGNGDDQKVPAKADSFTYLTSVQTPEPKDETYYFKEWNTKKDGTGTTIYMAMCVYTPEAGKTIYAIWGKKVKVSFDPNGGSTYWQAQYVAPNDSLGLYDASEATTRLGHVLLGWSMNPKALYPEYDYDGWFFAGVEEGVTKVLYAIWLDDSV